METDALLLTIEEAAKRLSISRSSLYILLQGGEIKSVYIGRSRRIAVQDLEEYIESLSSDLVAHAKEVSVG